MRRHGRAIYPPDAGPPYTRGIGAREGGGPGHAVVTDHLNAGQGAPQVPEGPWPTASSSRAVLTGFPATPVPSWGGPERSRTAAGVTRWSGRPCRCSGPGRLAGHAPWLVGREYFRGRRHPARDVPLRSGAPCPASGWRLPPLPWTARDRGPRPARRLAAYCSGDHGERGTGGSPKPGPAQFVSLRVPTIGQRRWTATVGLGRAEVPRYRCATLIPEDDLGCRHQSPACSPSTRCPCSRRAARGRQRRQPSRGGRGGRRPARRTKCALDALDSGARGS